MSLINKMLQDLDARGGAQSGQGSVPQMRPAVAAAQSPRVWIATGAGAAVLLAAAGGWAGWKYLHREPGAAAVVPPARAQAAGAPAQPVQQGGLVAMASTSQPAAAAAAPQGMGPQGMAVDAKAAGKAGGPDSGGKAPGAASQSPADAVPADAGDAAATFARRPPRAPENSLAHETRAEARKRRLAEEKAAAELAAELKAAKRKARLAKAEAEALAAGAAAKAPAKAGPARAALAAGNSAKPAGNGAAQDEAARPVSRQAAASEAKAARAAKAVRESDVGRLPGTGGVTVTSQQQGENAYRRGLASLQEGRVPEAIASMEQAVFLYPRHDTARQTLVGLLIENKRHDEALRHLQFGLGLDPRQPQMAMILARLQMEKGGPAIDTLQRTLPYASGNADYVAFLAGALQRAQRHKEAAEQYQAALRLQPQNGVWWMGLGISLQGEKRNADAQDAYTRARNSGNLSQELQNYVERKLQQLAQSRQ